MYYKIEQMKGYLYELYLHFCMSLICNSELTQTTDKLYFKYNWSLNRDAQEHFHNVFSDKNATTLKIQKPKNLIWSNKEEKTEEREEHSIK